MVLVSCTMMELHAQPIAPAWNKNIGGYHYEEPTNVISRGNHIVIAGYTVSQDGDFQGYIVPNGDFFWMQLDLDGNILRLRTYGGTNPDKCRYVIRTAEGGFLLVGMTQSTDIDATSNGIHIKPGQFLPEPDMWVVKINSRGEIEWQHAYGGFASDEAMHVIQTDDNGDGRRDDGYAIVGRTTSNSDGDVTNYKGGQDTWVIKISATGELQWQRTLGGSRNEYGRRIEQTPDGGYIVLSDTYSGDKDVEDFHGTGIGIYSDIWIVKLDPTGQNIEWQKAYGGDLNDVALSMTLIDDDGDGQKDDGFIITGEVESSNGNVPPRNSSQVGYDMILVKFNMNGDFQWHTRFGGTRSDRGNDVIQTNDGGYAVLGSTESTNGDLAGTGSKGWVDIILLKYTANGTLEY